MSRYKVVERGRRLVTIDTVTGQEIGLGGAAGSSNVAPPVVDAGPRIARPEGWNFAPPPSRSSPASAKPATIVAPPTPYQPVEIAPLSSQGEAKPPPAVQPVTLSTTVEVTAGNSTFAPYSASTYSTRPATGWGTTRVVTQRWYDNDAPREVYLSWPLVGAWLLAHHWRVIIALIVSFFLISWTIWLLPLLIFPPVRRLLTFPIRSAATKMLTECDQTPEI